jgi:hypothetical protein
MPDRSYLGIDINDDHEWIVALLVEGKLSFLRTFKNTSAELIALVGFIGEHCSRPKICIKPTSRAALKLLKFIGDIPDVEIVMMSEAGLRMHRSWLPAGGEIPCAHGGTGQAVALARCAERMI